MGGQGEMVLTSFEPEPSSVAQARRFVVDAVRQLGVIDAEEPAELLVSELVTNAVVHAQSPVRVELGRTGDQLLTVRVCDEGSGSPRVEHVSVWSEHGRGLQLVEAASHRWGVEHSGDGKCVWFELVVDEPASS